MAVVFASGLQSLDKDFAHVVSWLIVMMIVMMMALMMRMGWWQLRWWPWGWWWWWWSHTHLGDNGCRWKVHQVLCGDVHGSSTGSWLCCTCPRGQVSWPSLLLKSLMINLIILWWLIIIIDSWILIRLRWYLLVPVNHTCSLQLLVGTIWLDDDDDDGNDDGDAGDDRAVLFDLKFWLLTLTSHYLSLTTLTSL